MATLQDFVHSIEFVDAGRLADFRCVYDRQSDRFYYKSEEEDEISGIEEFCSEEGRFIEIPDKSNFGVGSRLAHRFTDERMPEDSQKVFCIFRKKGAYFRFKNHLFDKGLLEAWYEYQEKFLEEAVKKWVENNKIVLSE